jgi:hypothetical protein
MAAPLVTIKLYVGREARIDVSSEAAIDGTRT